MANDEVVKGLADVCDIDHFLEEVYRHQESEPVGRSIDYIFKNINDWLLEERMDLVDGVLMEVDVNKLNADLLLSFLTITSAAADHLPERKDYYKRAQKRMTSLHGWFKAQCLLKGL